MFRLSHLQNRHFSPHPPCLNRGLRGFLDYTDYPTTLPNCFGLCANCDFRTTCVSCLNHRLRGLEDYTDYPTALPNRFVPRTTHTLRPTYAPIHILCPTYVICICYTPRKIHPSLCSLPYSRF